MLVTELSNGSEKAFRELFDHFGKKVFHYSLKMVKNTEDAEELLHDVFLKIWQFKEQIDPKENFEIFLFTVARNHLLNFARKRLHTVSASPDQLMAIIEPQQEYQLTYKELYRQYRLVLEQMGPKSRQVFELSREHGLSNKDIAQRMGISVRTVETHISNVLSVMKGELKDAFVVLTIFLLP